MPTAGDPFAKVFPGQSAPPSATAWNALIDMLRQWREQQGAGGQPLRESRDRVVVRALNNSGGDLDRWAILAIGDPIITPTENEAEFESQVTFEGDTPTGSTPSGRWVVLLEPILDGSIGRAVISGVTACRIAVPGSLGTYAECADGVTATLTTGSTGSARVLWAEGSGTERWAVVRLGDGSGTAETFTALAAEEADGSPAITGTTLRLDQDDGFVVSQPAAGVIRVDIQAATTSQAGIVSTGTQTFGGDKTFQDDVDVIGEFEAYGNAWIYDTLFVGPTFLAGDAYGIEVRPVSYGIEAVLRSGDGELGNWTLETTSDQATLYFTVEEDHANVTDVKLRLKIGGTTYTGATGTDALGNEYRGGIIHTVGAGTIPTQYTDELAQDAVGTILADSDTVDFTYNDGTPNIVADVRVQHSITSDASGLKLSGDSASPGNTKYYGTNGSGTKGWYDLTSGFPKGYIYGLDLAYASASTFTVAAGIARDATNAVDITLASPVTVTVTGTSAAALGTDAKSLSGTGAVTSGAATVTGTASAFLTEFGTRTGTGTIAGASTTITGTSTLFLTEFSVDDLIGTATHGYARITAIASNTSLTIAAALPGGNPSGNAPVCIENPTITVTGHSARRVNTIASNTSLTVTVNFTATNSGNAMVCGTRINAGAAGGLGSNDWYIWLATGGSGTTVYVSTQRTTPFGVTGYTTSLRRIGSLVYDENVGTIIPFRSCRKGNAVEYIHVAEANIYNNRVVNGGGGAAWTRISARRSVPSTAHQLILGAFLVNPAGAVSINLRCAGVDSYANLTSPHRVNAEAGGRSGAQFNIGCDTAQCFEWTLNVSDANNPATIEIGGYSEVLP